MIMNSLNFEHSLEELMQPMEESAVKNRLKQFIIKYLRIPITEFEESIDVSNSFVNKIRKSISEEKLERITKKYPMLNPSWLMLGIGNMLLNHTFDSPINIMDMKFLKGIILPVYDIWNQIGKKSISRAMQENLIIEHLAVPGTLGCIGWIKMKGDYMFNPTKDSGIKDGEFISLREQPLDWGKIDYGSVHYLEFKDDRDPVVRYARKGQGDTLILRCENPKYDDIYADLSAIECLYKVENANRRI